MITHTSDEEGEEKLGESRRLLFIGMTRAMRATASGSSYNVVWSYLWHRMITKFCRHLVRVMGKIALER